MSDHAVVGAEVVTPLRNTVRLVDGDERRRALGKHLRKTWYAKPLGRDKQEVEVAGKILNAGLARDATVETRVNAGNAAIQCRKLRVLILHESDQRRDDEGRSTQRDGRQLIAQRLPCPCRHDQQQVSSGNRGSANSLLVRAELRESKHRVQ